MPVFCLFATGWHCPFKVLPGDIFPEGFDSHYVHSIFGSYFACSEPKTIAVPSAY